MVIGDPEPRPDSPAQASVDEIRIAHHYASRTNQAYIPREDRYGTPESSDCHGPFALLVVGSLLLSVPTGLADDEQVVRGQIIVHTDTRETHVIPSPVGDPNVYLQLKLFQDFTGDFTGRGTAIFISTVHHDGKFPDGTITFTGPEAEFGTMSGRTGRLLLRRRNSRVRRLPGCGQFLSVAESHRQRQPQPHGGLFHQGSVQGTRQGRGSCAGRDPARDPLTAFEARAPHMVRWIAHAMGCLASHRGGRPPVLCRRAGGTPP